MQSYQRGSILRAKRAKTGDVWEWRYPVRGTMQQKMFPCSEFPTKALLWAHLESRINMVNAAADIRNPDSGKARP